MTETGDGRASAVPGLRVWSRACSPARDRAILRRRLPSIARSARGAAHGGAVSEGPRHGTTAAAGVARVRVLLRATRSALVPLAAAVEGHAPDLRPSAAAGHEVATAAREASRGLDHVENWLQAVAPAAEAAASVPAREPLASSTRGADHLAGVLRTAIDDFEALGEAFEDDDPIVHFDAVQATGLATAVLEAAHQRLLRAGLVRPRPASLRAP